jgi:hypothetical protein
MLATILLGLSSRGARAQNCLVDINNFLSIGVQATVFDGGDPFYDDYYTQKDISPGGCKWDGSERHARCSNPGGIAERERRASVTLPSTPCLLALPLTFLPSQLRTLGASIRTAARSPATAAGGGRATARGAWTSRAVALSSTGRRRAARISYRPALSTRAATTQNATAAPMVTAPRAVTTPGIDMKRLDPFRDLKPVTTMQSTRPLCCSYRSTS